MRQSLGIEHPILQAPIGSATTPALAAAVSNAGGLGTLALTWRHPDQARRLIRETKSLTARPFGVNFVLSQYARAGLDAALEEGVAAVSFSWGDPAPLVSAVKAAGARVVHMVASAAEAVVARDAGVDVIVAQGWEAGGHVQGEVSTLALVPRVVDAVGLTPVVAAGGIADGRGVAAALALGAAGAWVGTRFLFSEEAAIHPVYRSRLALATETDTRYGQVFDLGWPEAPHRVLDNSTFRRWAAQGHVPSGRRPGEGDIVARRGDGAPILRYSDIMALPDMTGDVEALALYAGQGVGLARDVMSAAGIVEELVAGTRAALDAGRESL